MRASGNMEQWSDGYPSADVIAHDIAAGWSRVMEASGHIVATFCMMTEPEPTYAAIAGQWLNDTPYITLHRVASDGSISGVFARAVAYALQFCSNLRVDTHADNHPMQRAIIAAGFCYCGTITLNDGSSRLAYQLLPANR